MKTFLSRLFILAMYACFFAALLLDHTEARAAMLELVQKINEETK